ncbi:SMP-30/gluconolactonase/LRE family protein [Lysobacter sp. CA199]|uniref:SMP-30/gluconolactonase/LRE family protein n=1 Tax=Lysobacter sp. CA199 TaxID=3455608 RepID=UPI003F8D5E15
MKPDADRARSAERIGDMVCLVGESPVWRASESALYWLDIVGKMLWCWDTSTSAATSWPLPERAGCMAMTGDGGWLLAMESAIYRMPRPQAQQPLALARMTAVDHSAANMRFNDGRCDRQGRFWAGTMVQDMDLASNAGKLYRYTADAGIAQVLDDLIVPNGSAFSPDGRTMYLSDSHPRRQCIWAFDYDTDSGTPHSRRLFVDMRQYPGRPDGAAVDVDGGYWICGNDAGRVHRFTPAGKLDRSLRVPVAKPAMCAFGGTHRDLLFVTSIRPSSQDLLAASLDGAVFVLNPGTQGIEEPTFAD